MLGFPIAICESNGDCTITKPEGTGGLLTKGTVAEQLVYEIHDPANYVLPDVVCDFTQVSLEEVQNGIKVIGARGTPPTPYYKVGNEMTDAFPKLNLTNAAISSMK